MEPENPPDPIEEIRERIRRAAAFNGAGGDAEDIAQEVTMVLLQKYRGLGKEDLTRLAFDILRKIRIGIWRKRTRRGEGRMENVDDVHVESETPDPEEDTIRKQHARRMGEAIAQMGEPCHTVLNLYLAEHNPEYIQRAIKAPTTNAVFIHLSRCKKRLIERMAPVARLA